MATRRAALLEMRGEGKRHTPVRKARGFVDERREGPDPEHLREAEELYVVRLLAHGMPKTEIVRLVRERWNLTRPLAIAKVAAVVDDLRAVDAALFDRQKRKAVLRHWLESNLARESKVARGHALVEETTEDDEGASVTSYRTLRPEEKTRASRVALEYARTLIDLDGLAEPRRVEIKGQVAHAHLHGDVREALRAKRAREADALPPGDPKDRA